MTRTEPTGETLNSVSSLAGHTLVTCLLLLGFICMAQCRIDGHEERLDAIESKLRNRQ